VNLNIHCMTRTNFTRVQSCFLETHLNFTGITTYPGPV